MPGGRSALAAPCRGIDLEVGPLLGRRLADLAHELGRVRGDIVPTERGCHPAGLLGSL